MPLTMGRAIVTGYFSTPEGNVHYSQMPENTNATAYIIIDNTRYNAYDLINYSFKVSVFADIVLAEDIEIASKHWTQNFTVLRGNVTTLKITFNTSIIKDLYPSVTLRGYYILVEWGSSAYLIESHRIADLKVGETYEQESFFTFQRVIILISSIAIGIIVFILIIAAKRDIQHYRARHRPQRPATPPSQPPPTPSPPVSEEVPPSSTEPITPPSTTPTEPIPAEKMELIPCPYCGSKIDKTQSICPNCGHELTKCVICNLIIEEDDPIETCPECGAIGHRAHFHEWVHVKGTCPICKKPLSF